MESQKSGLETQTGCTTVGKKLLEAQPVFQGLFHTT